MSLALNWRTVKLGDIAEQVIERVDNPKNSKLAYYIGLEHIESNNLKISKYGKTSDVISSKFLCKKGDIIFGRRRAYLRKLAISDRDALVSTDAIIIRPKADVTNEFLVLVMQTDKFWDEAISRSAGSLSPRVKWKDIGDMNLALPPRSLQEKISSLVFSVQDNIEKSANLIQITEKLKKGLLEELLTKGIDHKKFRKTELGEIPEEWELRKFSEVIKINPETLSNKTDADYAIEYIDISSIGGPNVILKTEKYRFGDAPSRARRIIRKRDVIISTVRPYLKGFAIIKESKKNLICSTGFAVLRETDLILADYIFHYCLSELFERQSNLAMVGSNYPSLNNDSIEKLLILLPSVEEQREIVCLLNNVGNYLIDLSFNLKNLVDLKRKLNNSLLSRQLTLKESSKNGIQ